MKSDSVIRTDHGWDCYYYPTIMDGPVFRWKRGYEQISASRNGVNANFSMNLGDVTPPRIGELATRVSHQLAKRVEPDAIDFEISPGDSFLAVCPRCEHRFKINLDCIKFHGCESDPHYGTELICPKCNFEEDVHTRDGD